MAGVSVGAVVCAARVIDSWHTSNRALEFARGRSWRLFVAWCTGTSLETTVFCPLAPAGDEGGVAWTTKSEGLERVSPGSKILTQPILATNGFVESWPTKWKQETTRVGHTLCYKLSPVYTRGENTFEALQDQRVLVNGSWASREEMTENGVVTSYARVGKHASAVLHSDTEAAVQAALEVHGSKTQAYSIGTVLRSVDASEWRDDESCTLASHILADKWSGRWQVAMTQTTRPRQALQKLGDGRDKIDDPARPTGTKVGPDYCENPDTAPMMGRANDLVAIQDRLDLVRNGKADIPAIYATYAEEFISAIVGGRKWEMLPLDAVLEAQDSPLQRVRNAAARAFVTLRQGPFKVKSFLKKEPIVDSGPVRNISTIPAETNLKIGRLCLSIAAYLKKHTNWYCAGVQPPEVAKRIVSACQGEARVNASDVSKMDACKNVTLTAVLNHALAVRLLPADSAEITELHYAEATCTAVTSSGEKYAVGGSQLSGSSTTTLHNTVTNAFMAFAAYREEGKVAAQAYAILNRDLFVGDDAVTHTTADACEKVANDLGYKMKAEVIPRGAEVPFLSRWFPNPWDGQPGSYQDPVRLMRKAGISFGDPARGQQQLAADKWKGLAELDPNMTVYTVGSAALRRITGLEGAPSDADTPWCVREARKEGGAGWPQLWDADRYFEMRTGVPAERLVGWFLHLSSWEAFMEGPGFKICNPAKVKRPTVDPLDPATPPPPVPDHTPPPAAATSTEAAAPARRQVEEATRDRAKQIRVVTKEENRKAARGKSKRQPKRDVFSGAGTWADSSAASSSSGRRP